MNRIQRIKSQIKAGTYETPLKLSMTATAMLAAGVGCDGWLDIRPPTRTDLSVSSPEQDYRRNLLRGIIAVESNGDTAAYNQKSGATGILQIREICLDDVNRICGLIDDPRRFKLSDRWDKRQSIAMFDIYTGYWADHYQQVTGHAADNSVKARIWFGGPNGWRYSSTLDYSKRVLAAM